MEKEILENKMSKLEKELLIDFSERDKIFNKFFEDQNHDELERKIEEFNKVLRVVNWNGAEKGALYIIEYKGKVNVVKRIEEGDEFVKVEILKRSSSYDKTYNYYKFIEAIESHRMVGKSHFKAFLTVLRIEIKNRVSSFIAKYYAIMKGQFHIIADYKMYYVEKQGHRHYIYYKQL